MREMATFVLDTFSGRKLNLSDPEPDQIAVEDIASALSKICRFGAQARHFYSVAQHAMLVSDLVIRGDDRSLLCPRCTTTPMRRISGTYRRL